MGIYVLFKNVIRRNAMAITGILLAALLWAVLVDYFWLGLALSEAFWRCSVGFAACSIAIVIGFEIGTSFRKKG